MHRAPPNHRDRPGCPIGLLVLGAAFVLAVAGLLVAAFLTYLR